ncbi:hypothetical protein [Pseudobacteroides cellulosolvens]|uniref:Uncharacterized protein n=1 Tax=Pseudobacteroides cellulosolvens ATCC 35603 = DSM 2933 TaxID=398512 RepID=A0A0L6JGT6_9FIRM|nr:hypothetical protein [Pseudobacteroides cellulosolvens]KNY25076.1 hypothetical protein Bccel_0333 [Pseudobacteroides cellulosolvens ATCC 35603 = DSM 2933]
MAKKILLTVVSLLCIMVLFTSCSDKSKKESNSPANNSKLPAHVGMYTNYNSSILLKSNGTFVTTIEDGNTSKMVFTGRYSLNGEEIVFNTEKMNGQEMTNTLNGTLKDGTINYDGGKPFYKDKDYVVKEDEMEVKEEPRGLVSASSSTPTPNAENSSPVPSK